MDPRQAEEATFMSALVKRLEIATSKIESIILAKPASFKNVELCPSSMLMDSDNLKSLSILIEKFINYCKKIDSSVETQATILKEAIMETVQKTPPAQQKVSELCSKIQNFRGKRELDPIYRVISEIVPMAQDLPPLFKGVKESGEFYRNKAFTSAKNGGILGIDYEIIVSWANTLFEVIDTLRLYAFEKRNVGGARSGELEQGPIIVAERDNSMMVGEKPTINAEKTTNVATKLAEKKSASCVAPLLELKGDSKWVIEGQQKTTIVLPSPLLPNHSIYIFKCKESVLSLEGSKFTTATIDQSDQFGLVVDRAISGIEIVHCKGVQIQILGSCPTISIDDSERVQIYLSKQCLEDKTQIITSSSSCVNLLVQDGDEWIEKPVSEQFVTIVDPGTLTLQTVPQQHI